MENVDIENIVGITFTFFIGAVGINAFYFRHPKDGRKRGNKRSAGRIE